MTFPKPIMTISELEAMGFPRKALYEWGKRPDFPKVTMPGGRKILVDTKEFRKFLAQIEVELELSREKGGYKE